ncbi:MAG: hypothetical protein ACTH2Q_06150 [Propionibacteriaceae bacterium]
MQLESVVLDRVAAGVTVLFAVAAVFSLVRVVVDWQNGGLYYAMLALVFGLNIATWGSAIKARVRIDARGLTRPGPPGWLIGWPDVADLEVVRPTGWWAGGNPYVVVHRDAGAGNLNLDLRGFLSRLLTGIRAGTSRRLVAPVQEDFVDAILAARPGRLQP